jgi:hypothetical protein
MDLHTIHSTLRELLIAMLAWSHAAHILLAVVVLTVGSTTLLRHRDAVHLRALFVAIRPRPHAVTRCRSGCQCRCRCGLGGGLWCGCGCGLCCAFPFPNNTIHRHLTWSWTLLTKDAMNLRTIHFAVRVLLIALAAWRLRSAHIWCAVAGRTSGCSRTLLHHRDAVHFRALRITFRPRPHTVHRCHCWRKCRCRSGLGCRLHCRYRSGWCCACTFPDSTLHSHHIRSRTVLTKDAMHLGTIHSTLRVLLIAVLTSTTTIRTHI